MLIDRPPTPPRVAPFDPVHDAVASCKRENDENRPTNLADSAISFLSPSGSSELAFRPKNLQTIADEASDTEPSSEDEGFSLVHRPKPEASALAEDPMSSPEVVPSNPHTVDVLALTGSAYPDDDDWTML